MKVENQEKSTVKMFSRLIIFAIVAYLIYTLKNVLTPFLIALFLAYLLNPFINLLQKKVRIKKRGFAVALGLLISLSILSVTILISIPIINKELKNASGLIKEYAHLIPAIPIEIQDKANEFFHSDQARELISSETINDTIKSITPIISELFTESLNILFGVFGIFFILLYLIFILLGYPKMAESWEKWIPLSYRATSKNIAEDLNEGMRNYFRGQATIAFIVGILFCIGFKIIDLPLALLLGVSIGALNLVPYLQILGFIPAFFLSILHSMETGQSIWVSLGTTALVFFIVQAIQESLLIPKIMNKVTGLHPAIILLSLSIWASLLGLPGLIIALPISTLIISYYKRYVNGEYK
jgi:predicted PurR-regulated permease PerM